MNIYNNLTFFFTNSIDYSSNSFNTFFANFSPII